MKEICCLVVSGKVRRRELRVEVHLEFLREVSDASAMQVFVVLLVEHEACNGDAAVVVGNDLGKQATTGLLFMQQDK